MLLFRLRAIHTAGEAMFIDSGGGARSAPSLQASQRAPSAVAVQGVPAQAPKLQNFSQPGPQLMHLSAGWVPQGQAYNPNNQQVMSSYNNGKEVLLSIQDKDAACSELKSVKLAGVDGEEPNKGGGIATDGEYLYVADSEGVFRYSMADIEAAQQSPFGVRPEVKALDFQKLPDNMTASYISVHEGKAYVGEYGVTPDGFGSGGNYGDDSRLMRLDIGKDGALDAKSAKLIDAPDYAQGVAVTDKGLLYTTSLGSDTSKSPNALIYQGFENFKAFEPEVKRNEFLGITFSTESVFHTVGELDYYAEELNIIDGEVWVTYESNAEKYKGKYEDNVGKPPENTSIQRMSLDDLDLSGTGVTAQQLADAAR